MAYRQHIGYLSNIVSGLLDCYLTLELDLLHLEIHLYSRLFEHLVALLYLGLS